MADGKPLLQPAREMVNGLLTIFVAYSERRSALMAAHGLAIHRMPPRFV